MGKQIFVLVFCLVLFLRALLLVCDYNYEYPDEYWQGPEIAFKIAFQYGHETWQWTMEEPIRNPIYQYYLSLFYSAFYKLGLYDILEIAPKLGQFLLAVLGDYYLLRLICLYQIQNPLQSNSVQQILVLAMTNWYYLSGLSRMYSNSFETIFTLIAFYYWKYRSNLISIKANPFSIALYDFLNRIIAILCYLVRPTSIIFWAVVWPYQLVTIYLKSKSILQCVRFILKNLLTLASMLIISFLIGSIYYGKYTWTDGNFFKYNIILKWSQLYGINHYLWYAIVCLPFILHLYLIPCVLNFSQLWCKHKQLVGISIAVFLLLSLSAHKEPRFIMVLLPYFLILTIWSLPACPKKLQTLIALFNILLLITMNRGNTGGFQLLRTVKSQLPSLQQKYNLSPEKIAIIYLCEPHALPAYSILQNNVSIALADSSPSKKLQHSDECLLLENDPQILFSILCKKLKSIEGLEIVYVVTQKRYTNKTKSYRFLMQNFEIIGQYNNRNVWQSLIYGPDAFDLYKRKNLAIKNQYKQLKPGKEQSNVKFQ